MANHGRFSGHRIRSVVCASVVGVALAAAGVLGGVGFAQTSVTSQSTTTSTGSTVTSTTGKITICHKTHSKKHPSVTISVSLSALPAHQRHGDTTGACAPKTTITGTTTTTTTNTTSTTTTTASAAASPGKSGEPHGNGKGKGHNK
jgi:hypothetical protein